MKMNKHDSLFMTPNNYKLLYVCVAIDNDSVRLICKHFIPNTHFFFFWGVDKEKFDYTGNNENYYSGKLFITVFYGYFTNYYFY